MCNSATFLKHMLENSNLKILNLKYCYSVRHKKEYFAVGKAVNYIAVWRYERQVRWSVIIALILSEKCINTRGKWRGKKLKLYNIHGLNLHAQDVFYSFILCLPSYLNIHLIILFHATGLLRYTCRSACFFFVFSFFRLKGSRLHDVSNKNNLR